MILILSLTLLAGAMVLAAVVAMQVLRGGRGIVAEGPMIEIYPAEGGYGTMITIDGQGWSPGEAIVVSLAPSLTEATSGAIPYAGAIADPNGHWQTMFRFPAGGVFPENHPAVIVVRGQSSGQIATAEFYVGQPTPTPVAALIETPGVDGSPTPTSTVTPTLEPTPTQPADAFPTTPTLTPTATLAFAGWRGEYYDNPNLSGTPLMLRDDPVIDFDWGSGAPAPNFPADGFSVRWSRTIHFEAGDYRFIIEVDDGARLWLQGNLIINDWNVGARRTLQRDISLETGPHTIRLDYFDHSGPASVRLSWAPVPTITEWKGEYFANPTLAGAPALVRNDPRIHFDWGTGAPAQGLPADNFSVRWTHTIQFEEGAYRFHARVDDGVRLWVGGRLIIDGWSEGSDRRYVGHRYLLAGPQEVRVEYFERTGNALIQVWWGRLSDFTHWRGEYYPNVNLAWPPAFLRDDPAIDFNWSQEPPEVGLTESRYSVRWTRWVHFDGLTRFRIDADDGIRVWIDDELILDRWHSQPYQEMEVVKDLSPGLHRVRVEYYQAMRAARVKVAWQKVMPTATPTLTPRPSATPTHTLMPPTSTATPTSVPATATATSTPTATTKPPTDTPMPTATEPSATETPTAEPTPTATVAEEEASPTPTEDLAAE